MSWESVLNDRPDYVRAIGMISIENGNLEIVLGWLFGAVIGVPTRVAQAIYHTPKSAFARLEILEQAAYQVFSDPPNVEIDEKTKEKLARDLSEVLAIHGRSKALVGKRHAVMHDSWGRKGEDAGVARLSLPVRPSDTDAGTLVNLATLEAVVNQTRKLIDDVRALYFRMHHESLIIQAHNLGFHEEIFGQTQE